MGDVTRKSVSTVLPKGYINVVTYRTQQHQSIGTYVAHSAEPLNSKIVPGKLQTFEGTHGADNRNVPSDIRADPPPFPPSHRQQHTAMNQRCVRTIHKKM